MLKKKKLTDKGIRETKEILRRLTDKKGIICSLDVTPIIGAMKRRDKNK